MRKLIATIIVILSSFNYAQDFSNNKISNCNKYKPRVNMRNLFITENDLDGIGRYFYNNLYLPDVIDHIETKIFYINFTYESFDKVKVEILFKNKINEKNTSAYSNQDKWKLEFIDEKIPSNYLPFLTVFLPDKKLKTIADVDIAAKLTDLELISYNSERVEVIKEINKIIYTPNSYCRIFDFPAKNDLFYEYFAGRNVVLNIPLTNSTYLLKFTIQNYVVNLTKDSFSYSIPLLFGSRKVTIDTVNIIYNEPYISKIETLMPIRDKYPINAYKPEIHDNLKDILSIGLTNTRNKIIALSQFGGKIYAKSRKRVKSNYPIEIEGPLILSNYHRLKFNNEINIGIKKIDSPLPLSIYNLLKKNPKIIIPPILEYFIYNTSDKTISLEIHSHLPELSYPKIETVLVQPNKLFRYKYIPTIIPNNKASITAPFETEVISKIVNKNSNNILKEETNTIKILPNDTMIFRMIDESSGMTQMFYNYLINWVKRFESSRLDSLLKNAASKTTSGRFFGYDKSAARSAVKKGIFNTYKEFTRHLVKAIYESLHSLNPIYSNETLDFGRTNYQIGQRIKYPAETLEQGRGNCIDSSVLFATLLEIIGLHPIIVIVPNHAFIGWETWQNSGKFEFLETTFLGYHNFSSAYKSGMEQNNKYSNMKDPPKNWKDVIIYIDVKKLRDIGLYSKH